MGNSAEVLGISYFGAIEGSPLIPFSAIVFYLTSFLAVVGILYVIGHHHKKPERLVHKIKLALYVSLVVKILFFTILGFGAAYVFIPGPKVVNSNPAPGSSGISSEQRIEIIFDRPIDRKSLEKYITPDVPGIWNFEEAIYSTHLLRKVTFYPTVTLKPDTTYTVTLVNIKNVLNISKPSAYTFSFTTRDSPKVTSVTPVNNSKNVGITSPLEVFISQPSDKLSEFEINISPVHPFRVEQDSEKRIFKLIPEYPWSQGVTYKVSVNKTNLIYHIPTNSVIERSDILNEFESAFTTKEAPGIASFSPTGDRTPLPESIDISFTNDMDRASVQENLKTEPELTGLYVWKDNKNVKFILQNIKFETKYKVIIPEGTKDASGGFLTQDVVKTFTTLGRVRVEKFYPSDGWGGVGVKNPIKIVFDQDVDRNSAQNSFSVSPQVPGAFSWEGNTMIFTPSSYNYSTDYSVAVSAGVKSVNGLASNSLFVSSFRTQDQVVKLSVPSFMQKYSLSCEIAALRMALAFKGVSLTEDEIIAQVGFDSTPKRGNIWGNPHIGFVGNINGRQMIDGYGIYWGPIAKVAKKYRSALEFQGWDIGQLTQVIANNNPVVIWVYSKNGSPVSWNTPDGNLIDAVRGEHAVVAIGFVGERENPSMLIVNDPLIGQVYWQRGYFEEKWNSLGRSGVVVY